MNGALVVTVGAAAVLVAWTLIIAFTALPNSWLRRMLGRSMAGRFVPRWNFFAPVPGTKDFHVVWRAWSERHPGAWHDMPEMTPQRRLTNAVWNPDKFARKATIDLALELLQVSKPIAEAHGDARAITLTVPYILLAARASQEASRHPLVEYFQ